MEAGIKSGAATRMIPVFVVLFFFNTFLLPQGISLALLLTPVWIYLLHRSGRLHWISWLVVPALVYAGIHLALGADLFYYTVSDIMLLATGVACVAFWSSLSDRTVPWDELFGHLVVLNFLFALLSLVLLPIPELKSLVWYNMAMTDNMKAIPRLKLFSYEASHYSYLIAPLAIFFYCKAMFESFRKALPFVILITIPLLLSLSFGVLACLLLSGLVIFLVYFRRIFSTRSARIWLGTTALGTIALFAVLFYFFPDNLIAARIQDMLAGNDTSARGRTYESFILAHKIIAQKSYLWGIGPGQLKLDGRNIVVQYYFYSKIPDTIRIPNACAETIVCFGYVGFAIRVLSQLVLFFVSRVHTSPLRLWIFLFLFIFQFTGSYTTNLTEYVFWMLAFSPAFVLSRHSVAQMAAVTGRNVLASSQQKIYSGR